MSTRRAWRTAVVLVAGLAVPGSSAGATADGIGLVVQIDNYAGVPHGVMSKARAEVEQLFAAAEVTIVWMENDDDDPACESDPVRLRLHVVNVEPTDRDRQHAMLGLAARPSRRAFVFYDRLLDTAASHPIDTAVVLGQVMAHELGHLLLPPGPHPPFGLMRNNMDLAKTSPSRFSETEARQLRIALINGKQLAHQMC